MAAERGPERAIAQTLQRIMNSEPSPWAVTLFLWSLAAFAVTIAVALITLAVQALAG